MVALVIASLFVAAGSSQVDPSEGEACTPHPTIHVTEDAGLGGFVLIEGIPVYRPGSGVTNGSGTQEDPYIIEGLCLASAEEGVGAIWLEDTSAHVLVRDNLILGAPTGGRHIGVLLEGASNVRIEDNHIRSHITGVALRDSDGIQVVGNRIEENTWQGIQVMASHDAVIVGNSLVDNDPFGIRIMTASTGTTIEGNMIKGSPEWGIHMARDSHHIEVIGNTIKSNGGAQGAWGPIGGGLKFTQATGTLVLDNVFQGNYDSLVMSDTKNTVIHGNNIDGSEKLGLYNIAGPNLVDARFNWWGCSAGPDSSMCDPVSGSNVDYSSHRASANPDAGV